MTVDSPEVTADSWSRGRRERTGRHMYGWANSAFSTTVIWA